MTKSSRFLTQPSLAFWCIFTLCLIAGGLASLPTPALAEQPHQEATPSFQPPTVTTYTGSETCNMCHQELHSEWLTTLHAQAFSSPIFQRDWTELGSQVACLACHTTGFNPVDGSFVQEGVSCESCHGPMVAGHPANPMSITPNEDLCATCHKSTTDEWRASRHASGSIQCQACHDPHAQKPKAPTITELCTNCHKENSESFTHGTHAQAGLECSNCHMYTAPREGSPIGGLVSTGHTFSVGSEACIGCHQDTVHTRDEIVKLTGEISMVEVANFETLQKQVSEQETLISNLKQQSSVRLYTGLLQGAIIGLLTGSVTSWIVGQRIRVVEENENE